MLADTASVTNLVMGILQDLRYSMAVPPTSAACSKSAWCKSYLLTGGMMNVSPWPAVSQTDKRLTAYILKDVPSYQVDIWDMSEQTIAWDTSQCEVYFVTGLPGSGITLCISSDKIDGEDVLRIMAFACGPDDPVDGSCLPPVGETMKSRLYQIGITINRRKSAIAVDRRTSSHLKLLDPGHITPETAAISPSNLTESFSTFLCPLGSESGYCIKSSQNGQFTFHIAHILHLGSTEGDDLGPVLLIANFVGASLFMHNPFWDVTELYGIAIENPLRGVPEEILIQGSPAREVKYVSPEVWTAVSYVASAAFLLILAMGALGWGLAYYSSSYSTSSFTGLDIFKLEEKSAGSSEGDGQKLADLFRGVVNDRQVVTAASEIHVERALLSRT